LFREPPANLTIEIYSASGIILSRKKYSDFAGRNLVLSDLGNYRQGIYFVRLITGTGTYLHKIIKTGQ